MMKILLIALLTLAVLCSAGNVLAAPDNNSGAQQYGWEGASGIAVPELDPGLLISALVLLVGFTFIMTSQWRTRNVRPQQTDTQSR